MKEGDKVWYSIPGDEPRQWSITKIWDTNTADGMIACLSRTDKSKRLKTDRCNAPLGDISVETN